MAAKSDADPREFLVDVSAEDTNQSLTASVYYFACDDAETFCVPVTQRYRFWLARDPDGGRRISGAGMTGTVRRLLENDADGDGRLVREELPEQMQGRFDRVDANQDGVIDEEELKQLSQRGRGGMMSRLFAADADGDGRISREEAPERWKDPSTAWTSMVTASSMKKRSSECNSGFEIANHNRLALQTSEFWRQ